MSRRRARAARPDSAKRSYPNGDAGQDQVGAAQIQLEQLRSSYGQVNSKRDHLWLPCLVRENGCQTLQKTYVWHGPTEDCHLKYIQTLITLITAKRDGDISCARLQDCTVDHTVEKSVPGRSDHTRAMPEK